jgi:hypothetical protein
MLPVPGRTGKLLRLAARSQWRVRAVPAAWRRPEASLARCQDPRPALQAAAPRSGACSGLRHPRRATWERYGGARRHRRARREAWRGVPEREVPSARASPGAASAGSWRAPCAAAAPTRVTACLERAAPAVRSAACGRARTCPVQSKVCARCSSPIPSSRAPRRPRRA